MPIKNFFLSLSLAPARSSLCLRPAYMTGMSLNCTTPDHRSATGTSLNCTSSNHPSSPTGTLLNCNRQNPRPSSGTTLNCTSPVSDPTPGMALNCNLGHHGHLGNIGDLGHLGHLSHLGYLGNNGNLDTLNTYPLDPAPTDSLPGAFITEMDPTDPGPSEGCYTDDSLDPPSYQNTRNRLHKSDSPEGVPHKSDRCPRWARPHLGDTPRHP